MAEPPELVVVGEGSAFGVPDRCLLSLAMNVAADTSADAIARVARLSKKVIDGIEAQGVRRPDIRTLGISLQDFFDQDKKRVTARVATYALSVTTPGLSSVGPLLAEMASVAGDALQIRGLHLMVADPQPLLEQARRAAVTDALARARQLAEAAGIRTGAVLSIEEDAGDNRPGAPRRMSALSAASPTVTLPVEGGTTSVSVHVRLRLAIEP